MVDIFINGVIQLFLSILFLPGILIGIPTLDFLCHHSVNIGDMCAPDPLASSSTSIGESIFTLLGSIFFYTVIILIIYFYRKKQYKNFELSHKEKTVV